MIRIQAVFAELEVKVTTALRTNDIVSDYVIEAKEAELVRSVAGLLIDMADLVLFARTILNQVPAAKALQVSFLGLLREAL